MRTLSILALISRPAVGTRLGRASSRLQPIDHPSEHPRRAQALSDDQPPAPYAMSYADEAAQNLGVRDGNGRPFDTSHSDDDPYMPALKGGVDGDGRHAEAAMASRANSAFP